MDLKIKKAVIEYLSHLVFISLAYLIYFHLPYFQALLVTQARLVIWSLVLGYSVLGLPYFIIRNLFFWRVYGKTENKSTRILQFTIFNLRLIFNKQLKKTPEINEPTRVALLSVLVKFFYFPIMLSFFIGNFEAAQSLWSNRPVNIFTAGNLFNWGYFFLYNLIFVIDTAIFTFAYVFEAKWLKNEIRSVDPFLSGWVFALICYPPFNGSVDRFLTVGQIDSNSFFSAQTVFYALRIGTLLCYLVYVWATVALWTKSSNLTNRGIVGHGPYKYIRHPAYAAKSLAWWLERLPGFTSPLFLVSILSWNFIYIMRALTEERHLLRDPEYRRYTKIVKYRFIPGLI